MTTFRIVALDPGGTTGWATFTASHMPPLEEGEPGELVNGQWTCGQIGPDDHHNLLDAMLGNFQVSEYRIVCESFEYRNRSRAGLELVSCEYIGVTKRFCQERDVPLRLQTASMGKITPNSFVKKINLERLGLWTPGYKHAMDGYGHLLYYLMHSKDHLFDTLRYDLLQKGWKG
jgi:hypothetical protein